MGKKMVSKIGHMPTMTKSIGRQDTRDEEMMVEHNYQIEIPTVCQSHRPDIDVDAATTEEIREPTDTKRGMVYNDMRTTRLYTWMQEGI